MLKRILSVAVLLFWGVTANAVQVIYADPLDPGTPENEFGTKDGIVIAIKRLDIGGTLYNVDFDDNTYPTYGGTNNFWSTEAEAQVAAVRDGKCFLPRFQLRGHCFGRFDAPRKTFS